MDTTRWQRIEGLFHELADLPPGAARDAALAARCGDDQTLVAEVRALLDQDAHLDADAGRADPHLGLRLGSYEITALIARGGMAAVYEARRADDQFEQRVAIKIMDLRLSDPGLVAQFRAERQILAALEHPSLTRLLDGGVTALGEPYLVMEFVRGHALDVYCDEHRLDVPARLRLFAEVCEGMAFAHRNLVLHRDLKPSNILVTPEGRAKVVDFGTATLLQPDRLATTSMAPLTPAYASPEQLTGKAVGTASDQYSLGLVLFELLTGGAAFGERTSLMAAVERALVATTTTAPHLAVTEAAASTRQTSLVKLRRTLSGDLATIIAKALAHEPAARYASVQHFADDVRRWLSGAPILARPPSLAYHASRFVRRHWVATSVAATLAVALVIATGVSLQQAALARRQADEARRQETVARTEAERTRQLNRFMTGMLSSANPGWINSNAARAGTITVREVLDGASQIVGQELAASPLVEAQMRQTIGATYVSLGAYEQGRSNLERALVLYRGQGDALGVAQAEATMATERNRRGHFTEAEALLRRALAYARSPGTRADPLFQLQVQTELATALNNQQPAHPEGMTLLREAMALADRHALNPAALSVVLHNYGLQLLLAGQLDEAEHLIRQAYERQNSMTPPANERFMALRSLSEVYRSQGNAPEALRVAQEAVDGIARVFPPEHPYQTPTRIALGRALVAAGQVDKGRETLLDVYATLRAARPAGSVDLLAPQVGLGAAHRLAGDLKASEAVLREARAIILANPGVKNSMPGIAGELGLTLRAMGRRAEADALLRDAHGHLQRIYGDEHPTTKRALARVQGANQ